MAGSVVNSKRWLLAAGLFGWLSLGLVVSPSQAREQEPSVEKAAGEVSMATSDGVGLFGVYSAGRTNGPGVVLLHQHGRAHDEWRFLTDSLQRAGFHVLAIDLRGHGKSVTRGESSLELSDFKITDYAAMQQDVVAAVAWLRAQGEVDGDRVAIIGSSLGANLALVYAASDPRVRQVAMLSPGLDYKGVGTEEAIQTYGDRPLFMAVSREDNYSAKSVLVLDATSTSASKELRIFTGAGHGTKMLAREPALETALLTWLNEPISQSVPVGGPPTLNTRETAPDVGVTKLSPD